MEKGKKKCNALRELRMKIAKANDIEYTPVKCTHKGDCLGTCPMCESELEYLANKMKERQDEGLPVVLEGLVEDKDFYGTLEDFDIQFPEDDVRMGQTVIEPINFEIMGEVPMKELKYEDIHGLKTLSLIIKQTYFDQILSGGKKQEFREVKPTTYKKLIELDENGYDKEDEYGNAIPIKYDAIRFYVGYNKDRDTALVEVESATSEIFVDEKGEPITYQHKGEEWWAQQITYNLGKVLDKKVKAKEIN